MALTEQQTYQEELERLCTARTEQIRTLMVRIEAVLPELETLEQGLQSRGLSDESRAVQAIIEKLRAS